MQTIHKYILTGFPSQMVEMPKGAVPLSVDSQHGNVCIWAEVDTANKMVQREVRIYGTGHEFLPNHQDFSYTGTFTLAGGDFIFHVYVEKGD